MRMPTSIPTWEGKVWFKPNDRPSASLSYLWSMEGFKKKRKMMPKEGEIDAR